jgi:HAD superfamily hydrolase (TIGR01509 family)
VKPIPFDEITTLFLDVGNTLISIDFPWVCDELNRRSVSCDVRTLRRAEAAARPQVSRWLVGRSTAEHVSSFPIYLQMILEQLLARSDAAQAEVDALVAELVPVLRERGTGKLWSWILPGVPEALDDLRTMGLRLLAVSNSDGTVEEALQRADLRQWFDAVVDSTVVGFEKPDPRIFEEALRVASTAPATTLHVGDLYEIDVEGARAASIHGALVDPFGDWHHVDCERFVDVGELRDRIHSAR